MPSTNQLKVAISYRFTIRVTPRVEFYDSMLLKYLSRISRSLVRSMYDCIPHSMLIQKRLRAVEVVSDELVFRYIGGSSADQARLILSYFGTEENVRRSLPLQLKACVKFEM